MSIRSMVFYAVMLLILSAGFYGGYLSYAAEASSTGSAADTPAAESAPTPATAQEPVIQPGQAGD